MRDAPEPDLGIDQTSRIPTQAQVQRRPDLPREMRDERDAGSASKQTELLVKPVKSSTFCTHKPSKTEPHLSSKLVQREALLHRCSICGLHHRPDSSEGPFKGQDTPFQRTLRFQRSVAHWILGDMHGIRAGPNIERTMSNTCFYWADMG